MRGMIERKYMKQGGLFKGFRICLWFNSICCVIVLKGYPFISSSVPRVIYHSSSNFRRKKCNFNNTLIIKQKINLLGFTSTGTSSFKEMFVFNKSVMSSARFSDRCWLSFLISCTCNAFI